MASTKGPTATITQTVNLSVGENVSKVQNETLPLSTKNEPNNTIPPPPAPSETVSKSTTDGGSDNNKTPTSVTVTNSSPDIPTSLTTQHVQNNSDCDAKPLNGTKTEPETVPASETTDSAPADTALKKSTSVGSAVSSTLDDLSGNLVQTKAPEEQNKVTPDQSCDLKNDSNSNSQFAPDDKMSGENEKIKHLTDKSAAISTANGESTASVPVSAVSLPPVSVIEPANVKAIKMDSTDVSNANESQSNPLSSANPNKVNTKRPAEDSDETDNKKQKTASASSPSSALKGNKTPDQILECMGKTFENRRKIITKQMPTIPELKELYPYLFSDKQLVIEFQRITKIDIDQKIQEFCVRNANAVIEMARSKKGAQPVLARWERAKQENEALKQYWDMVTALCLLPLHFGENLVEMVLEIGEDEEVQAQGKIVPTLVARGNIFRTDEFFLIAENTIVQEFEEFTIAFASLYSSYWVFNMVYPETIENTYNFIQRCIVKQKEPGAIPNVCKNFTKTLQKWNKTMKKT